MNCYDIYSSVCIYFFIANSDLYYNKYIEFQAVNYRVAQLAQEHMVIDFNFLLPYMMSDQGLQNINTIFSVFSVVLWVSMTTFCGTVNGETVKLSVTFL